MLVDMCQAKFVCFQKDAEPPQNSNYVSSEVWQLSEDSPVPHGVHGGARWELGIQRDRTTSQPLAESENAARHRRLLLTAFYYVFIWWWGIIGAMVGWQCSRLYDTTRTIVNQTS